jgi:hypothetical protein
MLRFRVWNRPTGTVNEEGRAAIWNTEASGCSRVVDAGPGTATPVTTKIPTGEVPGWDGASPLAQTSASVSVWVWT